MMVTPGCPHTDCRGKTQSQCCPAPPRHHLAAAWLLSSCLDNVTCSGQHGVISASMFYISLSHFMDIFYAFYCFFFFSMAKFPLFTSHSVELKVNHETTIPIFYLLNVHIVFGIFQHTEPSAQTEKEIVRCCSFRGCRSVKWHLPRVWWREARAP